MPHKLRFTSVFVCPLTGECFASGRYGTDPNLYQVEEQNVTHGSGSGGGGGGGGTIVWYYSESKIHTLLLQVYGNNSAMGSRVLLPIQRR